MIKDTIKRLVADMIEVKDEYPNIENSEILRIFNLAAVENLTLQIKRAVNNG